LRTPRLIAWLVLPQLALAQNKPAAVKAWFTDAEIADSVQASAPADAPPAAPGTAGKGVSLTKAAPVENVLLQQQTGLITFWIRPNWNGNDGKTHRLLRIGDPEKNGLLLEKSAANMLRYVMACPHKQTASRADVSSWKAGEWHHVGIAWFGVRGKPLGLALWIDKVAVAGPIAGGNEFLDPAAMEDKRVWIGDETADAVMDELIFRDRFDTEKPAGQLAIVYRDYFRTAPYEKIAIEPDALRVPSDRRVVAGGQKQFGLRAGRGDQLEDVTNFEVRYGPWAEFDAKPLIKWTTSDEKVAAVDANGLVTGKAVGKCALTAELRGMKAKYDVEVIPVEQPDLDLLYVERLPRYPWDQAKDRPDVGDAVESVVHIENFGYQPAPAGTVVRFELIPDANRNFRLDAGEKPVRTETQTIDQALAPRAQQTVTFKWVWPAEPTWVRVTVDPDNKVAELCEANNQVCELNTARPLRFAYNPKQREEFYTARKINHVGSFSLYDWVSAEKLRMDVMVRETVLPCTSPDGIQDAFRTDNYYELRLGKWEDEPYNRDEKLYDGGFPVNETIHLMNIDIAIIHEFGHCILSQPDLYGYPMHAFGVLLKDEQGAPYAGSDLLPIVTEGDDILMNSSANNVPCAVGYNSLMNHCHLWLCPSQAGHVQWFRGFRGSRFWGSQGRLIPTREHFLRIYDVQDQPLKGAAVYVYGVTQTDAQDAGTKFFADRPKFMGNTDAAGRYQFPDHTDEDWDDPDTDAVEGALTVWNPFHRAFTTTGSQADVAFTPNVWCVEGLLLVKIVSGEQTEFYWLPLTELNEAFFNGDRIRGTYPIRTSLSPAREPTAIVRKPLPDIIRKVNLKPKAVVAKTDATVCQEFRIEKPESTDVDPPPICHLTVHCGQEFSIDGSRSSDPEGQPLIYRWHVRGPGDVKPRLCDQAIYKGTAPKEPAELEVVFYVIDGLRVSRPVDMKLHVVAPPATQPAGSEPAKPAQ
jgi:hypothetical protein